MIDLGCSMLRSTPDYGRRELLVLCHATSIQDRGDALKTVAALSATKVRCSVVHSAAEVNVCARIAAASGGQHATALSRDHYHELLLGHVAPPPELEAAKAARADMVQMGFPRRQVLETAALAWSGGLAVPSGKAYVCPKCRARNVDLPTSCAGCSLPLVSSPHLARSHHHLFPVLAFDDLTPQDLAALEPAPATAATAPAKAPPLCFGCGCALHAEARGFRGSVAGVDLPLRCPKCRQLFCVDCDLFCHDQMHNCPGCLEAA